MERKLQGATYATLDWDAFGSPCSPTYSESYFDTSNPLAERDAVFLRGNDLPQRFSGAETFCIGELGFGTGLSFLLTLRLWQKTAPPGARLEYLSFESSPVSPEDMKRALSRWPELSELSAPLIKRSPAPVFGHHRLDFPSGVSLTLVIGDAREMIYSTALRADAWFLDGFSPKRNPELWEYPLLAAVTERTAESCSLSTYSVARKMREHLSLLGWSVSKESGHPSKSEFLVAKKPPKLPAPQRGTRTCTGIAVIGGGIAGSAVAYSISRRGYPLTLLEDRVNLAEGASGNPAGILMPHVSLDPDPMSRFYIAGYLHSLRLLTELSEEYPNLPFSQCGVLRLASSDRLSTLYHQISATGLDREGFLKRVSKEETEDCSGLACELPGLFFPQGAWVSPQAFTRLPIENNPLISVKCGVSVKKVEFRDGLWRLFSEVGEEILSAEIVVIANAHSSLDFSPCEWFPLEPVRGQIINQAASETSLRLRRVVCFDGYILPAFQGQHSIGATYDHHDTSSEVKNEQSRELLTRVSSSIPELRWPDGQTLGARVSFRAMSRDRLPLIGGVPNLESYSGLSSWREDFQPEPLQGLYVSVGHGSRGLISAHLSAEVLAARIFDEPSPLPEDLLQQLLPERYLLRLLKRGVSINSETAASWKVKSKQFDSHVPNG